MVYNDYFSVYYRKMINHRDFRVNTVEYETTTKISIPVDGVEEQLVITGEDATQIVEARHQIHSIIDYIRSSHPPMQFISIPVLSDEIKENFNKFKVSIY